MSEPTDGPKGQGPSPQPSPRGGEGAGPDGPTAESPKPKARSPLGLFVPCFVDLFEPHVGIATVRVLERLGFQVDYPPGQTCCGQPHFNAGHLRQARSMAKHFCEVFSRFGTVVSPSGSCTSMVRNHYPSLIGPHTMCDRVFELCEFLVQEKLESNTNAHLAGRAVLHVGCHARRELGAAAAAERVLSCVEGLSLVEVSSDAWCCGFGGTFSVKFPEISTAMGERRLEPILAADVDYLISTDSSCLLQLAGMLAKKGLNRPRPLHVAEVLAGVDDAAGRKPARRFFDFQPAPKPRAKMDVSPSADPLSWPMREVSRAKTEDRALGDKVHRATLHTVTGRARLVAQTPEWEELRKKAKEARLRAIDRHDSLLDRFTHALEDRGVHVRRAHDAKSAADIITRLVKEVARPGHAVQVTKAKSMTSEEVGLNAALEKAGARVTETDLGELIVQLDDQPPSHVTAPAIHLSTEDIARIFRDKLAMSIPSWVESGETVAQDVRRELARDLSLKAREVLRERFLEADVGISGANFLVAESGTVVLLENEGNIQLTTGLPARHIVLAGVDKLIENEQDLGVMLRLLPVSATAQRQTCYVSLFADRHQDMHVVLLDHGRRALLGDEKLRELLLCIRCGACMNVCPVYRNVGGHAYGGAYPGPIGALLLPQLEGLSRFAELPFASSLCGACTEICPVGIPLHEMLLEMRARVVERGLGKELGWTLEAAAVAMGSGWRMGAMSAFYPLARPFAGLTPAGRAWASTRELPKAAPQSFRSWWKNGIREETPSVRDTKEARSDEPIRESWADDPAAVVAATTPEGSLVGVATNGSVGGAAPLLAPALLVERFAARVAELGPSGETSFHHVGTEHEAISIVRERISEVPASEVLIAGEPSEKRGYQIGITSAELLIADTGGILLDLPDRTWARASTLAETHVAIVEASRIVATVEEALALRQEKRASGEWTDFQVIVTGPSRTADVEKVLVIPAHGPRRLEVVLCDEPVDLGKLRSE